MTQLTFTQDESGWWKTTIPGFKGILQVDRSKAGMIEILASTDGCREVKVFSEYSESTLLNTEFESDITLHINCSTEVQKAQYNIITE